MPCRLPHYFDMEKIKNFFHTKKHIIYYNDLTYKKKSWAGVSNWEFPRLSLYATKSKVKRSA
jgi:hypothetical protein